MFCHDGVCPLMSQSKRAEVLNIKYESILSATLTSSILVLPSAGLSVLDGRLEVEVGSSSPLPVGFYGMHEGQKVAFTQCHRLPLEVTVSGWN